ncbi:hypothetical protein [Flavimarina sp. Hel_I_48]|uniref:hypothetical protein n=1 Tax=Flavimarina sp. Hel_I_48 TaxID=1392488 RepID=UPI0004DF5590|nr:hypothetical protein [Flavimarina sp. Hel_I_48]
MKEKKEIDRLFQERFKNFEAHPSDEVWSKIEQRLGQKKKKKVVPLWWKLSGAAALLALLLLAGNLIFAPKTDFFQESDPQLVTEDSTETQSEKYVGRPDIVKDSIEQSIVSNTEQKSEKTTKTDAKLVKNMDETTDSQGVLADSEIEDSYEVVADPQDEENSRSMSSSQKAVATNTTEKTSQSTINTANTSGISAKNGRKQLNSKENRAIAVQEDSIQHQQNVIKDSSEAIVTNESAENEPKDTGEDKSLDQVVEEERAASIAEENSQDEEGLKNSKRWAVMPNVAPVYYNSFSGSGIAPQFEQNTKEGGVNMSYGVLLSYAVNEKITVRSGLHKIDLSYTTNDAILSAGFQGNALQSASFNKKSDVLMIESAVRAPQENASPSIVEIPTLNTTQGFVNQSLAYYEIPMEIEYAVLESRIGLQFIGGLSTLFLNDNALVFNGDSFKTELPEATNLNDVSFSTNVGVGLNYKFTDEIKFNLEPMFKYQLNAYKNNSSDFKPYYLGLYTGFSIKF